MYERTPTKQEEGKEMKGFTLVETLVAVTILLLVIVGPMGIASKGLQSAYHAGDQTTAIYLAQEAVEYIQKLRDDIALQEFLNGTGNPLGSGGSARWYNVSISNACINGGSCDINLDTNTFISCGSSPYASCRLNHYPSPNGVRSYGYSTPPGYAESPYTRRIQVGDPLGASGPSEITGVPVTVTVTWYSGLFNSDRTVTLQTYIYDSYARYE